MAINNLCFDRSLILFSSLTRFINGKYLIKLKHMTRMLISGILMFVGFILIAFACTYDTNMASFYVSLLAAVFLGIMSALGESTVLGFCKGFPSTVVGYFGSGTGFAGVFGAGILLILRSANVSLGVIFFIVTPTVIPYLLGFWWLNRIKSRHPFVREVPYLDNDDSRTQSLLSNSSPSYLLN
jgi:MFS family permease